MDYSKPKIINDGYGGSYIDMTDSYREEFNKYCINSYKKKESVKMDGKKDSNIGELIELQKQMIELLQLEDRLIIGVPETLGMLYGIKEKVRCCFNYMAEKIRKIEGGGNSPDYCSEILETEESKEFTRKLREKVKRMLPPKRDE